MTASKQEQVDSIAVEDEGELWLDCVSDEEEEFFSADGQESLRTESQRSQRRSSKSLRRSSRRSSMRPIRKSLFYESKAPLWAKITICLALASAGPCE